MCPKLRSQFLRNIEFNATRAIAFLALFTASLWCDPLNGQWMERGGPNGNYRVDAAALEGVGNAWSEQVGISDSETIVDGDHIFLTAADFSSTGLDATRVLCLNRLTGAIEWSVLFPENSYVSQDIGDRFPVRPLATPYLSVDRIVCVGYGGSVRCLDKVNGKVQWEFDLVKDFGAEPEQYGFATSPWGDGKQVLIACGGSAGTILSIDLATGKKNWSCGTGMASYCSFVEFTLSDGSMQIVYAANDELLAVDPNNGTIAWQYPYPKQGLTNAVTPIAVDKGKLLVAGQGLEGTRLLSVERDSEAIFRVEEVWRSAKQQPFYCNWVQLQSDPNLVIGFASKTLFTLDWPSGKILSQSRGWTDCNLVATPDAAIAVRGDGFVGKLEFRDGKPVQVAGYGNIRDRVWCAPTIADGSLIVRGRTALYSVPLSRLRTDEPARVGTAITSMDAMYGSQVEAVEELIAKAKNSNGTFAWEDYFDRAYDNSVQMSDGSFVQLLKALESRKQQELGLRIATDWVSRQPMSMSAFQWKLKLLRELGRDAEASQEENSRLVEVEFLVTAKSSIPIETKLSLTGNTPQLGSWDGVGLQLVRDAKNMWRAKTKVPRGDLQFKVTGGSMDQVETRADGRGISNRRFRVQNSCEIQVEVAALKVVQPSSSK